MVDPSVVDRGAERLYCNTFPIISIILPKSLHSLYSGLTVEKSHTLILVPLRILAANSNSVLDHAL